MCLSDQLLADGGAGAAARPKQLITTPLFSLSLFYINSDVPLSYVPVCRIQRRGMHTASTARETCMSNRPRFDGP